MNLFAYGTLMFPAIWRAVVGREAVGERATVPGYAVYRAPSDVFPVMVRGGPNDAATGIVYRDLDDATIQVLDDYEAGIYDRVEVVAKLATGESIACQCYLLGRDYERPANPEPWDVAVFERDALPQYLERMK
jgi:gamma-glutamylcyclotransferase (GGCT)/AIG2-like uncharacterized protein YtfP